MEIKNIILVITLVFVFTLVYSPHFDHEFPYHVDEWYHLDKSLDLKEEGFDFFGKSFTPVEFGFQFILFILGVFIPLIKTYQFLPAINAVIISIILFYFVRKKYNYWVALLSIIIFASLKSNVNIMGLWFFVPMSLVIIFDYACLFRLEEVKKDPSKIYWVVLFMFLIAFIHPSSFLAISLVVLIYFILNHDVVKRNYKKLWPFGFLMIPAFLMLYNFYNGNIKSLLSKFLWGPSILQINFNPFLFYGILLSLLAALGFYITYRRKELLTFRIWIIISLVNLLLFPLIEFTIFSSYQRYLYQFMIAAVPLSAIGSYAIFSNIAHVLRNYNKTISFILIGVLFTGFFCTIFHDYYDLHPQTNLYEVIDQKDYEAMLFLKENGNKKESVMSPEHPGVAISTITNKKTKLALFHKKNKDLENFFSKNCTKKRKLIQKHSIDYLYSYERMNCSFSNQIYNNSKVTIYDNSIKE